MRLAVAAIVVALAGCPYVPEGEIRVEEGALPVTPGARIGFALYCDQLAGGYERVSGPEQCGRDWTVQGETGGSATFGAIDSCGAYKAPVVAPPEAPLIAASECPIGGGCADACGAGLELELDAAAYSIDQRR